MKKNNFILLITAISLLFSGGYNPSYGPSSQWNVTVSTVQAFMTFDGINLNGLPMVGGEAGGGTGVCPDENCDILSAVYSPGQCLGLGEPHEGVCYIDNENIFEGVLVENICNNKGVCSVEDIDNEEDCAGVCSVADIDNEEDCAGVCSITDYTNQEDCIESEGEWTQGEWTQGEWTSALWKNIYLFEEEDCQYFDGEWEYRSMSVGWTYGPITNGAISLTIETNDGVTAGTEYYPQIVPGVFDPIITFNFYDASDDLMYYNIGSSNIQIGGLLQYGVLDIESDSNYQSSDGFSFGAEIFPLGGPVCNTLVGPYGDYYNFSSFGGSGDSSLCGYYNGCTDIDASNYDCVFGNFPDPGEDSCNDNIQADDGSCLYGGCTDSTAVNYDSSATIDDDSCGYAGCQDPAAGNYVINGSNYSGELYDCIGNPGVQDTETCCLYDGCNDENATNYIDGNDCNAEVGGVANYCCTYAPIDIVASYSVIDTLVDSETYLTSNIELIWNDSDSTCSTSGGDIEWSYVVCVDGFSCDTVFGNSIVYDIGWSNTLDYSISAFGCALDIEGELYGHEINGSVSTGEKPLPAVPGLPAVIDSGLGFIELEWEESYLADYYNITFTNILNSEDIITFIASNDSADILLNHRGSVSAIFYPLVAGTTYEAQVSAGNYNSNGDAQNSSMSAVSSSVSIPEFEIPENGFMIADSVSYPYSVELSWDAAPEYGFYPEQWTYQIIQTGLGVVASTLDTTILIYGLSPASSYEFTIFASSGYGEIQGEPFTVSTIQDAGSADWGFQVMVNHLGYGYIPVSDEENFFGFSSVATNNYDNNLDLVEPPTAFDFVKFYFVREDWEEDQIGWGSHYTQELRSRQDENYAFDNYSEEDLAVFKARLVSNMPGFSTFTFNLIDLYGDAPIYEDSFNYCPVYLKLMAYDEVNYYKIEDNTEFTIQINGSTEYDMEFIVGNIVPDAISNFSGIATDTHVDPINIRPHIDLSWDDHDQCEFYSSYEICNAISSRYPQTGYILEFNDGSDDAVLADGIFEYTHSGILNLSYGTEYTFTLSGSNNSGKGVSSQINIETLENLPPKAYAGGIYDNDCSWDDFGCGNTYLTPHDGDPNSSIVEVTLHGSGSDPEGLGLRFYWNQISGDSVASLSENYSIVSLIDTAIHEPFFSTGLSLDSDPIEYVFELTVTDTFPSGLAQINGYDIERDTVTITVLPESNLSPVADLDVTRTYSDDVLVETLDFRCMAGDTIIYIDDESAIIENQTQCEATDGQWVEQSVNDFLDWNWEFNNTIGPIWQVPHDGNPNTNFANIQLVNNSYDSDGGETFIDLNDNNAYDEGEEFTDINNNETYDEQIDDISILWNRSTPPETYIDANGNGVFDYGEPFNDLNNNGYYDWSEAIGLNILTTRTTPGVDTVQIFIEDSYGYKDTSQMVILILEEPNEIPIVDLGDDVIEFITPYDLDTYTYECLGSCTYNDPDNIDDIIDELNLYWHNGSSNIDEAFELPEGSHELTLCAVDPYGAQGCDTKLVTIYQEPLPDKIDNFDSYQDLYYIELSWQASDLQNLSENYIEELGYSPDLENVIVNYDSNRNAKYYKIYRDNVLIDTIERDESNPDQLDFTYIDNGLQPSTTYNYKIIPLNSHNREGLESDILSSTTTDIPTIRIKSPNGTEIWASSYYDIGLGEEVIRAFPIEWEMTSVQNIRKINIFVSHDNGYTWEQAENFYEKNVEQVCSDEGVSIGNCETTDLSAEYSNPMSCEASGHNWIYDGVNSCFAQIIELDNYTESVSPQDLAVQDEYGDVFALSPQIDLDPDNFPYEIFNQGDGFVEQEVVSDETFIKGEGIEINHNTLVKIVAYDRGDYYDNNSTENPPNNWVSSISMVDDVSDGAFTLSSNKVTRIFDIGWHLFGPPVKPYTPRMFLAFQEPHGFGDWAYDWIAFAQSGSFVDLYMQMGHGYYLNNTSVGNLTIYGDPVTSANFFEYEMDDISNDNYSIADIKLNKGWNLISNTLVRPVSKYNFEVIHLEDNSNYTFDQAVNYGFVQPSVYTFDSGYFTTNSIYPFEGYFWHAARGDMLLKIRPHDFEQLGKIVEDDIWTLELTATNTGDTYRDKVIIGLGETSKNLFKYGEDEIELPMFADEVPVDLVIEENFIGQIDENGVVAESDLYFSNIKKMINEHQSQVWKINFKNNLPESPLQLSWNYEDIDEYIDINLYFEGKAINMKSISDMVIDSQLDGSFVIVVGQNPLASNLGLPAKFNLGQAHPNPFNPVTSFNIELNEEGLTSVSIYNISGQLVEQIYNGVMSAGYHQLDWNALDYSSGLYVLKLKQGENIATQKLLLIK